MKVTNSLIADSLPLAILVSAGLCWSSVQPAGAQRPDSALRSISVIKGQHRRLPIAGDIQRVAVGDADVLSAEPVSTRELLLLGKETGRTSVIVWLRSGAIAEYAISVRRDLTMLSEALAAIHPSIQADMAPDRDAIVLTGLVPDLAVSQAAESVARNYLEAAPNRQSGAGRVLFFPRSGLSEEPAAPANAAAGQPATKDTETVRVAGLLPPSGRVINLLRLERFPPLLEEKLQEAAQAIAGPGVRVRRILRGAIRDDAKDTFVLEGRVPNQVALVRAIAVAAQIVTGRVAEDEDIRVVADEAGSLSSRNLMQGQQGQSGFFGGGGGSQSIFGGGGGGGNRARLNNLIRRNLGRAKIVEAADGRILSFLEVEDLPQVRVDIRLYEVNRNKLREFDPNTVIAVGDFNQSSLNPAQASQTIQGRGAPRVGGGAATAFQNVLGFLGGTLSNQLQLTTGRVALDVLLSYLERFGIARSLSSPSLTVLSGEIAIFQVGGEIPIPEAFVPSLGVTAGAAAIPQGVFSSVVFRSFGVELDVRPLVGDDDTITLDLIPQVAAPNAELTASLRQTTGTAPLTTAFQTRALRTSARLQDGQALLIGGLLSRNARSSESSTPGVRDVPGLGWLFRGFQRSEDELELVIVVNPVLLREPARDLPMWEFEDPIDLLPVAKTGGQPETNKNEE